MMNLFIFSQIMSYRQVPNNPLDSNEKRNSLRYGQQQVSINMSNMKRSATLPKGSRNLKFKSPTNLSAEASKSGQFVDTFLKRSKSIENKNKIDQQKGNVSELIQDFMFNEFGKDQKTVLATFGRTMDDTEIYRVHRESFQDLFNIIDNTKVSEQHQICLKIIYYFLDEFLDFGKGIDNSDIQNLIERVAKMMNTECRNQILKVFVVFLENTKDETYTKLKEDIIKCALHNPNDPSMCKMSYKMMMNHCDQYFFKLAFLLKENLIMEFKVEYKKLLKTCKNYFGEYWTYAIKQNAQLLYLMTDAQQLVDTREFLLLNTKNSDLKSRITVTFKILAEFQSVYKTLSSSDESLLVRIYLSILILSLG